MKAKVILIVSLVLMLATAGSAMAAPANGRGAGSGTGACTQQGVCDGTGGGYGSFTDADGDGVCDLGTQPQDGTGMQNGRTK